MNVSVKIKQIFIVAIGAGILAVSFSPDAYAQDLTTRASPRMMQGIRPLGMGGAFVAADGADENTLFYNPAAIAEFPKEFHWQFFLPAVSLPTAEASAKAIPFFASDLPSLAEDIDKAETDSDKIDVFNDFTAKHTGRYEEVGTRGNIVQVMHRHITGSIFFDNRTVLALVNPSSSTFDVEALTHFGLQFGSAAEFLDKHLLVGAAIKILGRHVVDETITQRDVIANDDFTDSLEFDNIGFGAGIDLGVKGRPPVPWKAWKFLDPVFALTVQDLGHTRFTNNVGQLKESATFGFALHPGDNLWKLKTNLVVDVRDLDKRSDFLNKLYAGYELTWPKASRHVKGLSGRLGLSQGYLTGGAGIDFKRFKFNAATWGREVGLRTRQKQSRMFGVQLVYGI